MILTCPACGTQYAVKDGSIPEGGRKVRCAACGHSWHQGPVDHVPQEEDYAPVPETAAAPGDPDVPVEASEAAEPDDAIGYDSADRPPPDDGFAEPPLAIPVPPEDGWPEQPVVEQQWDPEKELPDAEEIDAVEHESGLDRKRNWLMGAILAVALVAVIVVALWYLAPDSLRQRVGFGAAAPSPLQIAPEMPQRQKLASGNELVVVSGRVINPSSKPQDVPPIEAQVRDSSGKILYSWIISPPAAKLNPGESVPFNSAEMGVPPSGMDSTVTLTLKS